MKHILATFLLLFITVTITAQNQDVITYQSTLKSLDTLRNETKKTYPNGVIERVYYYTKSGEFVRVVNFTKEGKMSSVFYLENGNKKEYVKFYADTRLKEQYTNYYSNKEPAVSIFYDFTEAIKSIYFTSKEGKDRFEVKFDLTNGGFSKRIFNTEGHLIRRIDQANGNISKAYYYNGKMHGPIESIDNKGNKTGEFRHYGMIAEKYEGWEKIIVDFDKIPALEKELDVELKKYNIILDDSLGKGIKIKFKDNN